LIAEPHYSDMSKIRVGFICGKDTDFVEHPGQGPKYSNIGDPSFLKDMPDYWRVDPKSHEYLKDCPPGTKGQAHCDVALAWYIQKHNKNIEADIITPDQLTLERLEKNDVNFTMGYNMVNIAVEGNPAAYAIKEKAFKKSKNLFPTWAQEEFILHKSHYMKACMDAGVPMAPTIFAMKNRRSPTQLLKQIKARGWKTFVMKQSESGFCLGFLKLTVEQCEQDPSILAKYFSDYANCPEYIVQEAIEGFTRNWETRCFWWNGKFLYAIANMAAVSSKDGKECIITGDDIPKEFLENAKRVGRAAIKAMPKMKLANGKTIDQVLLRTDIGCCDSELHDNTYNWNPNKKTFFLNEIEPNSTTYFVRWLKFDCLPLYGKLYARSAKEIYKKMLGGGKPTKRSAAKAKTTKVTKVQKKTLKGRPKKLVQVMKTAKSGRKK